MKNKDLQQALDQFHPEMEIKILVKSPDYDIEDGDVLEITNEKSFIPESGFVCIMGDYVS